MANNLTGNKMLNRIRKYICNDILNIVYNDNILALEIRQIQLQQMSHTKYKAFVHTS